MAHLAIREKIMQNLDELNELERRAGPERMMEVLAERYHVPIEVIEMALAEWEAGKKS